MPSSLGQDSGNGSLGQPQVGSGLPPPAAATETTDGLMSAADKTTVDTIRGGVSPVHTTIPDADQTIAPSTDKVSVYVINNLTANRVITLDDSKGSPISNTFLIISILVNVDSAFTVTIQKSTGPSVLNTIPAHSKGLSIQFINGTGSGNNWSNNTLGYYAVNP